MLDLSTDCPAPPLVVFLNSTTGELNPCFEDATAPLGRLFFLLLLTSRVLLCSSSQGTTNDNVAAAKRTTFSASRAVLLALLTLNTILAACYYLNDPRFVQYSISAASSAILLVLLNTAHGGSLCCAKHKFEALPSLMFGVWLSVRAIFSIGSASRAVVSIVRSNASDEMGPVLIVVHSMFQIALAIIIVRQRSSPAGRHDPRHFCPDAIHLIDEGNGGDLVAAGLAPDGLRLRLHTANGTEHGDGTIKHPK